MFNKNSILLNFQFLFLMFIILTSPHIGNAQDKKFSKAMLENPKAFASTFEKIFNVNEVPIYNQSASLNRVILENGYVQSKIVNPKNWSLKGNKVVVTQIDFIFTKYPKNKEFWLTNYYELLANRVSELLALDSTLNSSNFEWNIILQTDCNNESEAKKMFHGIAITYFFQEELLEGPEINEKPKQDSLYFSSNTLKVENYIYSQGGIGDSLIYRIFDRNRDWKNALVVMDWTGSMYQYGSQAVLWHILNFNTSGIHNFVFFNDGDKLPDWKKEIGKTGGIYFAQANNLERLINTFYLVGQRGQGGDTPENDFEALLTGMNRFEDFDELILIADNNSCVRDFELLSRIDVKVNVILCGAEKGINPQYITLAYQTGGSIHTINSDIKRLGTLVADNELSIEGTDFKLFDEEYFRNKYPSKNPQSVNCDDYTKYNDSLAALPQLAFIQKHGGIHDSTVFKVLQRHPLWSSSILVMDWSKNMYTNSAQAILWHQLNRKISGINHFIFTNDGNKIPLRKKKIGKTGGIYYAKSNNIKQVLSRGEMVERKGNGGQDNSINLIEAAIEGASKHQKEEELILIADNNTCIRDLKLLKYLNMPIKIIVCNIDDQPLNIQFLNLALRTKGSIHLLKEDIYQYVIQSSIESTGEILIGKTIYVMDKNGLFTYKDKSLNAKEACGKFQE